MSRTRRQEEQALTNSEDANEELALIETGYFVASAHKFVEKAVKFL